MLRQSTAIVAPERVRRSVFVVLVPAVLVMAAMVIAGCTSTRVERTKSPSTSDDIELVESFARVTLPDSTTDLRVHREGRGMDDAVAAEFRIGAGDLERFIADAQFTEPPERGVVAVQSYPALGWELSKFETRPDRSTFLGHEENVNGFVRQVMIDVVDPQQPVVYLLAFET